jgi:hypothetical protein
MQEASDSMQHAADNTSSNDIETDIGLGEKAEVWRMLSKRRAYQRRCSG